MLLFFGGVNVRDKHECIKYLARFCEVNIPRNGVSKKLGFPDLGLKFTDPTSFFKFFSDFERPFSAYVMVIDPAVPKIIGGADPLDPVDDIKCIWGILCTLARRGVKCT